MSHSYTNAHELLFIHDLTQEVQWYCKYYKSQTDVPNIMLSLPRMLQPLYGSGSWNENLMTSELLKTRLL